MRRLLLDQGLPRSSVAKLRDAGVDAVHAGDVGLSRATDAEILQYAVENDRVVVTLDADFHTMLALQEASSPSVVRIRIEGLGAVELAELLLSVDDATAPALSAGAAVSVTQDSSGSIDCRCRKWFERLRKATGTPEQTTDLHEYLRPGILPGRFPLMVPQEWHPVRFRCSGAFQYGIGRALERR